VDQKIASRLNSVDSCFRRNDSQVFYHKTEALPFIVFIKMHIKLYNKYIKKS